MFANIINYFSHSSIFLCTSLAIIIFAVVVSVVSSVVSAVAADSDEEL